MTRHTTNDISINAEKIEARQLTDSHPILFLHGLGSSVRDWELQSNVFSARNDVLMIDLRGHGLSDKPAGPYSIDQMADDVAGVLAELDTDAVHVVGLSMGAQVGLQLALNHPERVRSITAINCPASMRPTRIKDKLAVMQRKWLVKLLGMERVGRVLAKRLLPGNDFERRRQVFAERWAENDPLAYEASLNAILDWDITARLQDITQPLLVVAAREDYTPIAWKEALADNVANAQLVIIDESRHATPVERPVEFNRVVKGFLRSLVSAEQSKNAQTQAEETVAKMTTSTRSQLSPNEF